MNQLRQPSNIFFRGFRLVGLLALAAVLLHELAEAGQTVSTESKACAVNTAISTQALSAKVDGTAVRLTDLNSAKLCQLSDQSTLSKINNSPKPLCSAAIEYIRQSAKNLEAKIQANCTASRQELEACSKQANLPQIAGCLIKVLETQEPARLREVHQILVSAKREAIKFDAYSYASIIKHRSFQRALFPILLQRSKNVFFKVELPGNPNRSTIVGAPTFGEAENRLGRGSSNGPLFIELTRLKAILGSTKVGLETQATSIQTAIDSLPAEIARLKPHASGMITAGLGPDGQRLQAQGVMPPVGPQNQVGAGNQQRQPGAPTPAQPSQADAFSGLLQQAASAVAAAKARGSNSSAGASQLAAANRPTAAYNPAQGQALSPSAGSGSASYRLSQTADAGAETRTGASILKDQAASVTNGQGTDISPRASNSDGAFFNSTGVSSRAPSAASASAGVASGGSASAGSKACRTDSCQTFAASSQFSEDNQLSVAGGVQNSVSNSSAPVGASDSAAKSILDSLSGPVTSFSMESQKLPPLPDLKNFESAKSDTLLHSLSGGGSGASLIRGALERGDADVIDMAALSAPSPLKIPNGQASSPESSTVANEAVFYQTLGSKEVTLFDRVHDYLARAKIQRPDPSIASSEP